MQVLLYGAEPESVDAKRHKNTLNIVNMSTYSFKIGKCNLQMFRSLTLPETGAFQCDPNVYSCNDV